MNFEEAAYESCHPVEKRRTHGSQTFRKGLCGSRMRLSNAICLSWTQMIMPA